MRTEVIRIAQKAKEASKILSRSTTATKNAVLLQMAEALMEQAVGIKGKNAMDCAAAQQKGLSPAMIDRLTVSDKTIEEMARGLREVANLPDPVGEVTGMWKRPNNLLVGRMRIPLGVIGIIYESRPNVTADAAGLCLKSGNAVILRGGSEAFHSNQVIAGILQDEAERGGIPREAISIIPFPEREAIYDLLQLEELLPDLAQSVVPA